MDHWEERRKLARERIWTLCREVQARQDAAEQERLYAQERKKVEQELFSCLDKLQGMRY